MTFNEALQIVSIGWDTWAVKPHNARWVKRLEGTPIPNDLRVCIAEALITTLSGPQSEEGEG